ncbi:PrsW family glutamic-type intramembrane protease [Anaeromyxobacter oryzisoli]|uniref:PrsW family glutamic-type intramembrane protease n=1 Tax=Anaeromyxobacter oryzisoli TaxID=2925408 RepID=UPI001F55AF18|nr:PrsW family glutamic-type intramembrane protease [Anaeromyxobacter sp. SG63]
MAFALDPALVCACALSAGAWAMLAAWRAPAGAPRAALRALLGGAAAFGIALGAYEVLVRAGLEVSWSALLAGGRRAAVLAVVIGLVEESAKLAGIALAVVRTDRPGGILGATVGVAAGFAALESIATLPGLAAPAPFARALLAPAAHAILAAPLGMGIAAAAGRGRRRAVLAVATGLAAAAALHGAADLSLATPGLGRAGYALALLAPVIALQFLRGRRPLAAPR